MNDFICKVILFRNRAENRATGGCWHAITKRRQTHDTEIFLFI